MAYRPSAIVRSRRVLALDFIRRFFIVHGSSPSFGEIASALDVPRQRAAAIVRHLADGGEIGWTRGLARSITLPRRLASFATDELLLELQDRGYFAELRPVVEPIATLAVTALVQGVSNQELHLIDQIDHLDISTAGDGDDGDGGSRYRRGGKPGSIPDRA